jgi:hypothetical protein
MLEDVMVPCAGWLAQPAMATAAASKPAAREDVALDTR